LTLRKFLILITILFFSFNFTIASTNENVRYVNIDVILNNSDLGKIIINKLKKQNDANIDKIKTIEIEIKKENEELTKLKNVITEEEFNKKLVLLKKKIDDFNILKNKLSNELNEFKKKEIKLFFEKINPIIEQYMEQNSIALILEKKNIFVARSDYDMTQELLDLINKN
jgi:outer membrane protein